MKRRYMALSKQISQPKFELTALIDVIFILVLFFAVSTSFNQHRKALSLTLPTAVAVKTPTSPITISIDRNQRVFWNGERVSEKTIGFRVKQQLLKKPNQVIILQADKNTPYVRVISVLDTIRVSGGTNIMLEAKQS